jgi:hypothetical protein
MTASETAAAKPSPFVVRDCALAALATGREAQNLRELRQQLTAIDPASIYYHFWGGLLRPRFDDPEFHNDFAIWARNALSDHIAAERLGAVSPTDFSELEDLRQELVELLEERLDEMDYVPWARADHRFYFLRSQIVVFDTGHRVENPEQLGRLLPKLSVSSVFYHFIDARRRPVFGQDDIRTWLQANWADYQGLVHGLGKVDPFFSGLEELRDKLSEVFDEYLG